MQMRYVKKNTAISITGIADEADLELVYCTLAGTGCEMKSSDFMTKALITGTTKQLEKFYNK